MAQQARRASSELGRTSGQVKNGWLLRSAELLIERSDSVLKANSQDVAAAAQYGLTDAAVDRLRLTGTRLDGMACGLREIAAQADPIGEIIESTVRPNGLEVQKVRVPLGVVFFIYESRPNVTADMRQERQCGDSAGRQGSAALEPRDRGSSGAGGARGGIARIRGAAGRHDRPRGGGPFSEDGRMD
jgi:hypothetical protein